MQGDALVPVGAAELVVALDREDRDAPVGQLDDGGVEGATAQVVDQHGLPGACLTDVDTAVESAEPVGECRRDGLRQHPGDVEARVGARLDGGLAFLVAEVGGHRDHRAPHRLAAGELGVGGEALENQRGDRRRRPQLAVRGEPPVRVAHAAFHQRAHVLGVEPGLTTRAFPDEMVEGRGEEDDRRHRRFAVQAREYVGSTVGVDPCDCRVGRAQVDAEDPHAW
ncbi:NAD-specific glutamate dehydrogenase [Mycobacteroides abscessus subsp. abscessus]|nr:NAD-specific glutamate dehydrogenase [Mycobacteroides abscessus subsp. abscessus]